ncbi:MAG TPA: zinc ribbon domain-containing protein [Solirubrobacteraceae bacterium]|nr:zinc ribbon domain-containing protein [Solirubrobacteraceae bacterium]
MPIYEYRCDKGHTFEVMQRMTDDPVSACATCSRPVQRVFHPVAVHFKGKGFYNTDYGTRRRQRELSAAAEGGSSSSSSDSSSSSSEGSSGSGSTTKSDTKPKTKSPDGSSSPKKKSSDSD